MQWGFPITGLIKDFVEQKIFAMIDWRFTSSTKWMTTSVNPRVYADINSGVVNQVYEKYPRLLLLVFMSAIYGFGMPIIHVLNLISLLLGYILDKMLVAWYFRKTPLYDDTMNLNLVYFMKWAGAIHIGVGYWMLSNH
jgi:hypothetical protein